MSSVVPDGWISSKLGSIGVFSKGKGISKKETLPDGIPCIRYAEIYTVYDFRIKTFKSFISPITAKTSKKLTKNDIIFAGSGETVEDIGKSVAFTLDCDAYVGGDSIVLSPSSDLDSTFLSYQLNDNIRRSQLRKLGQGSSVIHIYSSGLQEVILSLPPLPEQKKIASILTSVDEVIENTQKQIDKLQDLKKATMNELLTKGIGHTEFKDSELGRIPKSWDVTKLGKVTERFYQGINTVADKVVYHSTGIPILQTKHITSGEITFAAIKYLDEATYLRYKDKFQPRHNDILLSNIGTIGKSVLVQKSSEYLIAWNIFLISVTSELEPRFAHLHLQKLDIENYYENLMTGNATKFVNKSNLNDILLTLPSIAEQVEISNILDAIVSKLELQKQKLAQTQSLKKSLMQDLLTGKVRVTVN